MTSRFQQHPRKEHRTTVKAIIKYLLRTKGFFLVYSGEEDLIINGYSDAAFQTDQDDSRSQSEFMFYLNEGVVSWKNSK